MYRADSRLRQDLADHLASVIFVLNEEDVYVRQCLLPEGVCLVAQTWLDSSNGAVSLGCLWQAVASHMVEYLTHWR